MSLLNAGSIKWFKLLVLGWLVISDLYLFHLIALLNPVFNCANNLLLSSVDGLTIGIYNFASVIASVAPVEAFIAGTSGIFPSVGTAASVVISVRKNFQTK